MLCRHDRYRPGQGPNPPPASRQPQQWSGQFECDCPDRVRASLDGGLHFKYLAAMATGDHKPVYVLKGSDTFLRDANRRKILNAVIGDADPQTCVSTFDADVELADVLDELRTLPFLASNRVVIILDADPFVSTHRQKLETYLEKPSNTSVLVLMLASFPGNTRLAKAVAKVGEVIECNVPEKGNLDNWLGRSAKHRGKNIDPEASRLLQQFIGRDLAALDSEMEKLTTYIGERDTVCAEDVGKVVAASAGPAAFAITNAITAGDIPAALGALNGVLTVRGSEFATLGQIAWHLRTALQAQQAVNDGQRPNLRMPPQQRNAFVGMLKRRPLHKLQSDMRRLIAADLGMKSGRKPKATLQELLIALCS